MVKGYVVNNTGRSKYICKRTVYPGQRLDLEYMYKVIGNKVPEGESFVAWLEDTLPDGWEVNVVRVEASDKAHAATGGRPYKEVLTATPEVVSSPSAPSEAAKVNNELDPEQDDKRPSLQYSTPRAIDKMTARDIYQLRLKDNPKRLLKHVTSIHKLRRALSLCKEDSRKSVLTRLIQQRIRELNLTL